jgi:FMN-dependent NADH-azoreductase
MLSTLDVGMRGNEAHTESMLTYHEIMNTLPSGSAYVLQKPMCNVGISASPTPYTDLSWFRNQGSRFMIYG